MAEMLKTAMGWNFASAELGTRVMRDIVDLVVAGKLRAVVGSVVDFGGVPAAIEALAGRETTGRTIVMV